MDFSLSDEQQALQASVQRLLADQYSFLTRRTIQRGEQGWSREMWRRLADLGVLGINVPEIHGGLGYGPIETMIVMNLFGSHLLLEPFLASAVVASVLLREHATPSQQAQWLPRLVDGQIVAVLAHFETGSSPELEQVSTTASRTHEGGYILEGQKVLVEHACAADVLLVTARTMGEVESPEGLALFLVPRETQGVKLRCYRTLDGRGAGDIAFESVSLPASARVGGHHALEAVERSLDFALAALCAEAVGVMQALMNATVEYLKTRQQFGRPIGSFQALQHRAADMLIALEQARSMSFLAVARSTETTTSERRRVLSAAKVIINRAARFIGQQAVQLHGGMGMTDELQVSHWFKRLVAIEMTLGDTDSHLARFTNTPAVR
jgi:alkylation response protein AidB-like acyl-CoA dehydrogenase